MGEFSYNSTKYNSVSFAPELSLLEAFPGLCQLMFSSHWLCQSPMSATGIALARFEVLVSARDKGTASAPTSGDSSSVLLLGQARGGVAARPDVRTPRQGLWCPRWAAFFLLPLYRDLGDERVLVQNRVCA